MPEISFRRGRNLRLQTGGSRMDGVACGSVRRLNNQRQAKTGVFAGGGLLRLADGPLRPDNEGRSRDA